MWTRRRPDLAQLSGKLLEDAHLLDFYNGKFIKIDDVDEERK
jgi:hypothetical protein